MTAFFDNLFTKYPIKTRRFLEILPGFISWSLILFPVWGSFFIPGVVAYFILFFDMYWLYRSFSLAVSAYIASKRIRQAEREDWYGKIQKHKDVGKIAHVVVIPNYKEKLDKLRQSIESLANQTFPKKQLYVVLAMEKREEEAQKKAQILIEEFKNTFGDIFASFHPDISGETKGKSSNQAYGGKAAYARFIETGTIDINFSTISSVDADSIFDKHYFAYLSFLFLNDSRRYHKLWQSANVAYNNFWNVPAAVRVLSFFGNLWRTGLLVQRDRIITNSTYSLSFKMLHEIGYWDTDVIPEDYRIFFKAFYRLKGAARVEPIFLKTLMDAPLSTTYWRSLRNKYQQEQRWSWGVSDDPIFIKWWLTIPRVPFLRKTHLLYHVLLDHFLWPVNWFIITVAANIMPFVNPVFSRTQLGYKLPQLAGFMLTSCLFALLTMIIIDFRSRPVNASLSKVRQFLFPMEFILLPIVGFFLATLPALISHTKLMFGKRMEYKVTEKM